MAQVLPVPRSSKSWIKPDSTTSKQHSRGLNVNLPIRHAPRTSYRSGHVPEGYRIGDAPTNNNRKEAPLNDQAVGGDETPTEPSALTAKDDEQPVFECVGARFPDFECPGCAYHLPERYTQDGLYRSLNPYEKEMRILVLSDNVASKGGEIVRRGYSENDTLRFQLETVSLEKLRPQYEAISYRWGDNPAKKEVIINGQRVKIYASAESTLRGLCLTHGHDTVWIDTICINQIESSEKSSQVNMMGDIYSNAQRTLIWLGKPTKPYMPAIRALYDILNSKLPPDWAAAGKDTTRDRALKSSPPNIEGLITDWQDVYSFFSNEWFTRVWIIQEASLAPEAICYQGTQKLKWEIIGPVARWLSYRLERFPGYAKKGIQNAYLIWQLGDKKEFKLEQLLKMARHFKATRYPDMVYAMLGMRHRVAQEQGNTRIQVSYAGEFPKSTVFGKATEAAIRETKSLDFLQHSHGFCTRDAELDMADAEEDRICPFPTWAFRVDCQPFDFANPIRHANFRWHADNGIPLAFKPESKYYEELNRGFSVQGVAVTKITKVSAQMKFDLGPDGKITNIIPFAKALSKVYMWLRRHCHLVRLSNSAWALSFAMTLAAGQDAQGRKIYHSPAHLVRLRDGFLKFINAFQDEDVQSEKSDPRPDSPLRDSQDVKPLLIDLLKRDPNVSYAVQAIAQSAYGRRLFITESGALGLGTHNSQPSDIVCILFGGSVPFILRAQFAMKNMKELCFEFVGDVFMEGLMQGEHIEYLGRDGKQVFANKTTWFDIR